MMLPKTAHTSRPWRIHEIAPDFRLEDVWALPTPGGPADFPRLVETIAAGDPAQGSSRVARALWATRWKLGELFGWDDPDAGIGARVPTLRDRLPADITWTVPGDNRIAGTYRGLDEVFGYFWRRRDIADRTFQMNRLDVLVGEGDRIAALTDGVATIGGVDHHWSTVGLYDVVGQ